MLVVFASFVSAQSIELDSAEHYDSDKVYLQDITEAVYSVDGNFSPLIFDGEWIRMTFNSFIPPENNVLAYIYCKEEKIHTDESVLKDPTDQIILQLNLK